jgi:beta-glucosidase-like glycosyl hydrolase
MKPLILAIAGYKLTEEEAAFFTKIKPFGFILFKRNMESEAQISELTNSLRSLFAYPIDICIDEEGGRVSRLTTSGIVPKNTFPPAFSFYELYQVEGLEASQKAVEENYFQIGQKLMSLGINVNFAPVADLLHEDRHKVIGSRSFGTDPDIVKTLCQAALVGIEKAGVKGCVKHIPGHGLAKTDSHLALPVVDESLEFLESNDFAVFRFFVDESLYAMTAHIVYRCLDAEKPITTSKKAIDYIREQIGFKGILITDAVEMQALGENIALNALEALQAGCNIVLYAEPNLRTAEAIVKTIGNDYDYA